jgi:hypothetical protein
MDWGCGSSGRVLALQVQSTELKPQYYQKLKKEKENRAKRTNTENQWT